MHEHGRSATSFNAAFAIGIGLNIAFVAIEAFYGWKIGSLALLADAGHNLSDVIGLVLAWGGALAGKLRPDARHTYGWKRASILAAFVNALLLLVAMGSLAWEAVHRLQSPQPVEGVTIMVVAGIGIVINTATALLFMRGRDSDLNIRGAFLHMAADALVSAGVVVAGGLALWFGWSWLDPVASLVIAAIIVVGTWSLFRQSLHLLFDGVPDSVDLHAVQALLEALPGVARCARPACLGHGQRGDRHDRAPGDARGPGRRCLPAAGHGAAARALRDRACHAAGDAGAVQPRVRGAQPGFTHAARECRGEPRRPTRTSAEADLSTVNAAPAALCSDGIASWPRP